jgi:hypothetical protein
MKKRVLSFAMAVVMVVACVPAIALGSSAATYDNALAGLVGTCSDGYTTKQLTDGNTSEYYDMSPLWWGPDAAVADPSLAYGPEENPCYLDYDMGNDVAVDKVEVWTLTGRDYRFAVYGTTDNTKPITEWTLLGEKTTNETMTADGWSTTLGTAKTVRYIRVYGTYNNANLGFHFNEVKVWGTYEQTENILNISPAFGGMENWPGSPSKGGLAVTQILIDVADSKMMDGTTVNGLTLLDAIKAGTYTTQLVINGAGYEDKILNINPASNYNTCLRFEPCIAEDPFIPMKGWSYDITLNVLDADGEVYAHGTGTWKCPMDPIYIYDEGTTFAPVPETKDLGWYGDGFDIYPSKLVLYPNHIATKYVDDGNLFMEMEIGNAIYSADVKDNPYRWNGEITLVRDPVLENGFTPVVGTTYNIVYKGYTNSTPSGTKTLLNIYNMDPVTFTATNAGGDKNFEAAVPFIYQFDAHGGKVFVGYDDETKVYTVKANMPDDDYTFSHWEVDGKKVGIDPTYTFTAVNGANSTVKAVYTSEKVEITWNVNGQTMTTLVVPGRTPVPPVDVNAGYTDKAYAYTFTGWDKALAAATEPTTYTASYTKEFRPARVIGVGKYGEGMENWGGETQMLFYLNSDGVADMTEVWNNRANYRFKFTFTWTEDGVTKTDTAEVSPWSEIFGNPTKDSLRGRFEIAAAPQDGFNPVQGVAYIVNVEVYDMTYADVIDGGYLYLKSENTTVTYVLNGADPITYEYYTITWTQNGETIATETWREGCTPIAPVPASYVEGNWEYTLITAVVEVSGNATYEIEYARQSIGGGEPGDVNGTGIVDIDDVTDLLKCLAGTAELTGNGDVDGSGIIDIADVTDLLKILAGN